MKKIIGIVMLVISLLGASYLLAFYFQIKDGGPDCGIALAPPGVDPATFNPCGIDPETMTQIIGLGIIAIIVFVIGLFLFKKSLKKKSQETQ